MVLPAAANGIGKIWRHILKWNRREFCKSCFGPQLGMELAEKSWDIFQTVYPEKEEATNWPRKESSSEGNFCLQSWNCKIFFSALASGSSPFPKDTRTLPTTFKAFKPLLVKISPGKGTSISSMFQSPVGVLHHVTAFFSSKEGQEFYPLSTKSKETSWELCTNPVSAQCWVRFSLLAVQELDRVVTRLKAKQFTTFLQNLEIKFAMALVILQYNSA